MMYRDYTVNLVKMFEVSQTPYIGIAQVLAASSFQF